MPTWIFYALLSPAIVTLVVFIDKYNLEKLVKDYRGMSIFSAIVGLIVGLILWVVTGFPVLSVRDTLFMLLTGATSVWGATLYFQLMSLTDSSKVIIFLQTIPVFTLILSFIFLGDRITVQQLFGFVLILSASILASGEKNGLRNFKFDKIFWLMFCSNFLFAISGVLFRFVVEQSNFVRLISFESFGWAIGGAALLVVFPAVRKSFLSTALSLPKFALGMLFGNELLFVISKLIGFLAISLGPVALVSVLSGSQVFFGVLLGWLLTLLAPRIFKEDISTKSLITKFGLAALMIIGVLLVS